MATELIILLFSGLVFISILRYNPARTYGILALLIFLGLGIRLGNGGFDGITYNYPQLTDTISLMALNLIIFTGGLHTSLQRIRPVLAEGLILSTLGSELLGGNRLIASYLIGITLGNQTFAGKEHTRPLFNSTSWLSQVTMFILLGLQVFPQDLARFLAVSLLPALFLILVASPIRVCVCMLINKSAIRKKLFVSWVGLKGATPIVFAFVPILQGIDRADEIFNTVFFVVLVAILIQNTTIGVFAKWLRLEETD